MSFPEPFPEDIWSEIREYPGNQKCCDCSSLDTDWGSISHGTLICLDCAGKHRSLGVQVSFVRSIRMDSWSSHQVEMMRQGGNDQIRRFFKKLEIENSPIQMLYCTKGANHYRERLKERVDKIISGEIKSEKRFAQNATKSQSVKLTHTPHAMNGGGEAVIDVLNIVFKDGPMGLTLTKDQREMAVVSKLVPGGPAQCSGVRVGDYVSGVSGRAVENYEEIMHLIPHIPRPLTIRFSRRMQQLNKANALSSGGSHFHVSRSDSSLFTSAASEAFQDSSSSRPVNPPLPHNISNGSSSSSGSSSSRNNSKDLGLGIVSVSKSGAKTLDNPVTPRVKVRDVKASPRCGSMSDGEEVGGLSAMNKVKMSPRGGSTPRKHLDRHVRQSSSDVSNLSSKFDSAVAVNATSDSYFEAGSVVRVLREQAAGDAQWSRAIVKRRHKDGAYKVQFMDDTSEAHVPASRITTSASQHRAAVQHSKPKQQQIGNADPDVVGSVAISLDHSNNDLIALIDQELAVARSEASLSEVSSQSSQVSAESPLVSASIPIQRAISDQSHNNHTTNHSGLPTGRRLMNISSVGAIEGRASPWDGDTVMAVFQEPPLGLTLTSNAYCQPEITKLVDGGRAMGQGVLVGDVLVRINGQSFSSYDEAMRILLSSSYPLTLLFRRAGKGAKHSSSSSSLLSSIQSEHESADRQQNESFSFLQKSVFRDHCAGHQQSSSLTSPSLLSASIASRFLSKTPGNREVDLEFSEAEFGFRLEECEVDGETVSVVTEVNRPLAAAEQLLHERNGDCLPSTVAFERGVTAGWILRGINHEKYISHAHSVATLKYAKRPVVIRFETPNQQAACDRE